jgi:diketogulonate reductase-like aldo/keto reductase
MNSDLVGPLKELLKTGKCRSIGVSNFLVRHLEELLEHSGIIPAVNQIEMSPYNYEQRLDTVELCREKGIIIEAYSPLTKATKLGDPRLVRIAEKYGKTSAQVLIRWSLQKGFVVLPKSVNQHRIIENADIFDFSISENDMAVLDGFNEDLATGWDPTDAP